MEGSPASAVGVQMGLRRGPGEDQKDFSGGTREHSQAWMLLSVATPNWHKPRCFPSRAAWSQDVPAGLDAEDRESYLNPGTH